MYFNNEYKLGVYFLDGIVKYSKIEKQKVKYFRVNEFYFEEIIYSKFKLILNFE